MPPLHSAVPDSAPPRLLADIGGTNARFALETAPGQFDAIQVLAVADYRQFTDAVQAYLAQVGQPVVQHAAMAIANPVLGDQIRMTNHAWAFSIETARRQLGLDTLLMLNDFTALAMAIPHLGDDALHQVGGGSAATHGVKGLVGAGTGLGVGGLIHSGEHWLPLSSEGGHVALAPADALEADILRYCWQQFDHMSAERLVSGPGLSLIHEALQAIHGQPAQPRLAHEIVEQALRKDDTDCRATLDVFCAMLGTVAANLAVTLGAQGGLYIGGGVVSHLGAYFDHSPFRARFEHKGRFSRYTGAIATLRITADYPAFTGAAAMLRTHLANRS